MNAQEMTRLAQALRGAGYTAEEVAAVLRGQPASSVNEPIKPIKDASKKRRTRAQRIAEANPIIRPQRAKTGKTCPCGRSMSKARTATINGVVRCHYCFSHR